MGGLSLGVPLNQQKQKASSKKDEAPLKWGNSLEADELSSGEEHLLGG